MVIVIGDLMLDKYIWGATHRISPEAPVPIVKIENESFSLGGACNVAANLVSLGAKVIIYGVIGSDTEGALLQDFLSNKNIESKCFKSNRATTTKIRIMSAKHQMLRLDKESTERLEREIYEDMLDSITRDIAKCRCLVLSDYLKGVLSKDFTQKLIKLANAFNIPVLCDPKGSDYTKYKDSTLITPNKKEAELATGIEVHNDRTLRESLVKLREICNVKYPLITLSEEGIAYLQDNSVSVKPTQAREVYDVSGAGDTVIAALAFCLSRGDSIESACEFANAAAAVVIGKIGSATASISEIEAILNGNGTLHSMESKVIFDYDSKVLGGKSSFNGYGSAFQAMLDSIKNKKIVFTNGCFDILHYGHVSYLQKARKLGDVLIIGLNSDESVRRLKGDSRPVNNQTDRAYVLASLESVSYVVIFNADTPSELIKLIHPDILVKGADYKDKQIAGSQYAKEVRLIDYIESKSTTNIINTILTNPPHCN